MSLFTAINDDDDVLRILEYKLAPTMGKDYQACQMLDASDWAEYIVGKIQSKLLNNIVCEENKSPPMTKFEIVGGGYTSAKIYPAGTLKKLMVALSI